MIVNKFVDIVDVQTFKTNDHVRPHVDLGEIDGDTMKELWDLKRSGQQKVGILLGTSEEIRKVEALIALYEQDTAVSEFIDKELSI